MTYRLIRIQRIPVALGLAMTDAHNDECRREELLAHAAPDLLSALTALVAEADLGEVDLDDDERKLLDDARAAIAKATGGWSWRTGGAP